MRKSTRHILHAAILAGACLVLDGMTCSLLADPPPAAIEPKTSSAEAKFFEAQVRPILVKHCLECHGVKKQEGGLRLDSKASLLAGAESGKIVVSGRPDRSRLIEAIEYEDLDAQMPPEEQLKPADIATLRRWVQLGLPWPESKPGLVKTNPKEAAKSHWAFQPIRMPNVPDVANPAAANTVIDRFVQAKLESRGLSFSAMANRLTLIRRATFDLIGLPPTADEVTTFEADKSPDAFARLIDRLLASPHYGERWGRHWLDVARYADNKGYVFFEEKKFPWSYTYRDYVIRSFNSDLPYDQFVLEQLAADQLVADKADKRPLAAMGFLTLGARFMNNTHDVMDDRIDVVTRGLMGLTVTCSRCHDHKFDPITQRDYYALYGVFGNSPEPVVPPMFTPPPDTDAYRKFDSELQSRMAKFNEFIDKKHADLVEDGRKRAAEYMLRVHERRKHPSTEDFMLLIPVGDLNPTMVLRWETYLDKARKSQHPAWSAWHAFSDVPSDEFTKRSAAVTSRLMAGADDDPPVNRLIREAFAQSPPTSMKDVAQRYGKLFAQVETRSSPAASISKEQPADAAAEELRQVLYGKDAPADVPKVLGWGFLSLLPDRPAQGEFKKLLKEVEKWIMTGPGAPPRAMALVDAKRPFESRVFLRGNPNRKGESVPRRFVTMLDADNKPFQRGSGRLELARAIVDSSNPLTARVIVNRVWLHHFGRGLVSTPSDFGLRSEPPTHPQLLDYLAADFMQHGWSIKRLHRHIMLSAVYQQQSIDRAKARRVDPENLLLWRMNRRRLGFEAMRDSLLAVADAHDSQLYGPPQNVLSGYVPRRTVYGFIDRMDLPELLRSFDFPSPVTTSPQRTSTTVPPQALFLMNNNFAVESARRILRRLDVIALKEADSRVEGLNRLLFGRVPTSAETTIACEFLGDQPTADQWLQYVHGLLMTNEFVFVD